MRCKASSGMRCEHLHLHTTWLDVFAAHEAREVDSDNAKHTRVMTGTQRISVFSRNEMCARGSNWMAPFRLLIFACMLECVGRRYRYSWIMAVLIWLKYLVSINFFLLLEWDFPRKIHKLNSRHFSFVCTKHVEYCRFHSIHLNGRFVSWIVRECGDSIQNRDIACVSAYDYYWMGTKSKCNRLFRPTSFVPHTKHNSDYHNTKLNYWKSHHLHYTRWMRKKRREGKFDREKSIQMHFESNLFECRGIEWAISFNYQHLTPIAFVSFIPYYSSYCCCRWVVLF